MEKRVLSLVFGWSWRYSLNCSGTRKGLSRAGGAPSFTRAMRPVQLLFGQWELTRSNLNIGSLVKRNFNRRKGNDVWFSTTTQVASRIAIMLCSQRFLNRARKLPMVEFTNVLGADWLLEQPSFTPYRPKTITSTATACRSVGRQ